MTHFTVAAWIDFVRGIESSDDRQVMKEHIDNGCCECASTSDLWKRIIEMTKLDKAFEPPSWAVQAAEAAFSLRKTIPFPAGKLEMATLLYDSSLQPMAVGVRGTSPVFRQLLFRSGSVCIDMRMQPKPGSDSVVLMGQLLDSAKPDHGISGISVSLLRNGNTISRNETNDVGEFDFGVDDFNHMQLVFGISGRGTIVVPVPDGDN